MAEDDAEKTEQATGKRRDDFRKKGQVAQSKEVGTAAILTASLCFWYFYASHFFEDLQELVVYLLKLVGTFHITYPSINNLFLLLIGKVSILLAPLALLVILVGFLATYLQIGFLFTWEPLQPNLGKLNPITGMGRFFSKNSLIELVKSSLKVGVVGTVAFQTVSDEYEHALLLIDMEPSQTLTFAGMVAYKVLLKSCAILIVLAVIDFFYQRWELEQKMKMTKQETKEEFKESEGDPLIKGKIRAKQREMAMSRMMAEVPKADVVITNPTHLSVALVYRSGEMAAPKVIAKGADEVAMKIREIARQHDIPMVENVPLARALYKLDLEKIIPEEHFKAVAEVLAYVYSLKRKK